MSEDDRRTMAGPPPEGWRVPKKSFEEGEYKIPTLTKTEDGKVKWENVTLEATLYDNPVMAKKIEQDARVDEPWPYSFPYRPGDKVPPELVEEGMERLREAGFERVSHDEADTSISLPELPYAVSMTKEEYKTYISIQDKINDFFDKQEKILYDNGGHFEPGADVLWNTKDDEAHPHPKRTYTTTFGAGWSSTEDDDDVSHPAHYTSGSIETIDFIQDKELGFALGNVIKYVVRAGRKDHSTYVTDLEKAIQYLEFEIKHWESKGFEHD